MDSYTAAEIAAENATMYGNIWIMIVSAVLVGFFLNMRLAPGARWVSRIAIFVLVGFFLTAAMLLCSLAVQGDLPLLGAVKLAVSMEIGGLIFALLGRLALWFATSFEIRRK